MGINWRTFQVLWDRLDFFLQTINRIRHIIQYELSLDNKTSFCSDDDDEAEKVLLNVILRTAALGT